MSGFDITKAQIVISYQQLQELQSVRVAVTEKFKEELQELCTLAANHVPVERSWRTDVPPPAWGCIRNEVGNPGYCDQCPAKKLCPYPNKRFSK